MFLEKVVLKICSKFTGEHLCGSVISIKMLCNVIEIKPRYKCFPVNLLHILRTPFTKNTSVLWKSKRRKVLTSFKYVLIIANFVRLLAGSKSPILCLNIYLNILKYIITYLNIYCSLLSMQNSRTFRKLWTLFL